MIWSQHVDVGSWRISDRRPNLFGLGHVANRFNNSRLGRLGTDQNCVENPRVLRHLLLAGRGTRFGHLLSLRSFGMSGASITIWPRTPGIIGLTSAIRGVIPANYLAGSQEPCKMNGGLEPGPSVACIYLHLMRRLAGNRVILIKRWSMDSDRSVSASNARKDRSAPPCSPIPEQSTFRLAEAMSVSHIKQPLLRVSRHRAAMLSMICFAAMATMSGLPRCAKALMVGATPGVTADTSMNPADRKSVV